MTAAMFVLAAAVGALLRHLAHERLPQVPLPIGIVAVNLTGSFLLGWLAVPASINWLVARGTTRFQAALATMCWMAVPGLIKSITRIPRPVLRLI